MNYVTNKSRVNEGASGRTSMRAPICRDRFRQTMGNDSISKMSIFVRGYGRMMFSPGRARRKRIRCESAPKRRAHGLPFERAIALEVLTGIYRPRCGASLIILCAPGSRANQSPSVGNPVQTEKNVRSRRALPPLRKRLLVAADSIDSRPSVFIAESGAALEFASSPSLAGLTCTCLTLG